MFKLSNYFVKQDEALAPEASAPSGGVTEAPTEPQTQTAPTEVPVEEPVPEKVTEPEPTEPEPVPTGEGYEDTFFGHAAEVFDTNNLNGQAVVDYFEANGEFATEHVEKMQEVLGKAQANILLQGIQGELARVAQEAQENEAAIFDSIGGEDNFKAAAEWIQSEESGWDATEKDDMNKLLDMGGNIAQWAAQLMWIGYSNAGAPEQAVTTQPVIRDGQKAAVSTPEPITLAEYTAGIKAAKTQSEANSLVARANFTRKSANALELGWKFG